MPHLTLCVSFAQGLLVHQTVFETVSESKIALYTPYTFILSGFQTYTDYEKVKEVGEFTSLSILSR